jgi:hypothetical protein
MVNERQRSVGKNKKGAAVKKNKPFAKFFAWLLVQLALVRNNKMTVLILEMMA